MTTSREIQLVERPDGMPTEAHFKLVETDLPDPHAGEILVQNQYMSVDPAMRPRLSNGQQPLNEAMTGGAIGGRRRLRTPRFQEGDIVQHGLGFRERFVSDGQGVRKLEPGDLPLTVYMHALGGTGFTAWGGSADHGRAAGRRERVCFGGRRCGRIGRRHRSPRSKAATSLAARVPKRNVDG